MSRPGNKPGFLRSWFSRLDDENQSRLRNGRSRIFLLCLLLFGLLSVELGSLLTPQSSYTAFIHPYLPWITLIAMIAVFVLLWSIWQVLLVPLIRLSNWADSMRAVNLDAQVDFNPHSDFAELGRDINMLGNMINQLSQETVEQLEKHTDYLEQENQLLVMRERNYLSHELHDSLAQTLASLKIQLHLIADTLKSGKLQDGQQELENISYITEQANNQIRELIAHFRVPMNEAGLISSIEEAINQTGKDAGLKTYFQNDWPVLELSADAELNLLRITQECLANARKHSKAETIRVMLACRDEELHLLVEDDGVGFNESEVQSGNGERLGLSILRDRAEQINASISIDSEPGEGTRISLQFKPVNRTLPQD